MAMVRITNGETTSRVPYAAYISMYKKLGFTIEGEEPVKPKKPAKQEEPVVGTKEEVEETKETTEEVDEAEEFEEEQESGEDAFVEEILEKPLSQWSVDELKEFVRIKNINTAGAKKTSEVRSIVKKFLDDQDKASVNS